MTGETIRDLLQPVVGQTGALVLVVSRVGQVRFPATEDRKLTGVTLREDGLVRLERETGWTAIDPAQILAVTWTPEAVQAAGQFL
jgi:hypothetical protein